MPKFPIISIISDANYAGDFGAGLTGLLGFVGAGFTTGFTGATIGLTGFTGATTGLGAIGCVTGLAVTGLAVTGLAVIGLAVTGLAMIGLAVIGLAVIGFAEMGFDVMCMVPYAMNTLYTAACAQDVQHTHDTQCVLHKLN